MAFAKMLKDIRTKAGLSQTELAKKAGLSQNAISAWEKGIREPSWAAVQALCAAMGLDCNAFAEKPTAKAKKK
jgi:uncharacterized protein